MQQGIATLGGWGTPSERLASCIHLGCARGYADERTSRPPARAAQARSPMISTSRRWDLRQRSDLIELCKDIAAMECPCPLVATLS